MMERTYRRALVSCGVALAAGCGSGESLDLDLERPPRAEVYTIDGVEYATGRLLAPEASARRGRAALDLDELRDGQLVSGAVVEAADGGEPDPHRFAPGVFKVGALVSLDADADVQLTSMRLAYRFSSRVFELERTIGRVLESGEQDVPIEVVLVNGLGELQIVRQSIANDIALGNGADVVAVTVEVQLVAVDALGSGSYVSNVVSYDIEMCDGCEQLTTQTYTIGTEVNP